MFLTNQISAACYSLAAASQDGFRLGRFKGVWSLKMSTVQMQSTNMFGSGKRKLGEVLNVGRGRWENAVLSRGWRTLSMVITDTESGPEQNIKRIHCRAASVSNCKQVSPTIFHNETQKSNNQTWSQAEMRQGLSRDAATTTLIRGPSPSFPTARLTRAAVWPNKSLNDQRC